MHRTAYHDKAVLHNFPIPCQTFMEAKNLFIVCFIYKYNETFPGFNI